MDLKQLAAQVAIIVKALASAPAALEAADAGLGELFLGELEGKVKRPAVEAALLAQTEAAARAAVLPTLLDRVLVLAFHAAAEERGNAQALPTMARAFGDDSLARRADRIGREALAAAAAAEAAEAAATKARVDKEKADAAEIAQMQERGREAADARERREKAAAADLAISFLR